MSQDQATGSFSPLVERRLLLVKDHTPKEVVIQIAHPYWVEEGVEAACPVAIHGVAGRLMDIYGIDPLDALTLAIKFVDLTLSETEFVNELCWPDGERYFPSGE